MPQKYQAIEQARQISNLTEELEKLSQEGAAETREETIRPEEKRAAAIRAANNIERFSQIIEPYESALTACGVFIDIVNTPHDISSFNFRMEVIDSSKFLAFLEAVSENEMAVQQLNAFTTTFVIRFAEQLIDSEVLADPPDGIIQILPDMDRFGLVLTRFGAFEIAEKVSEAASMLFGGYYRDYCLLKKNGCLASLEEWGPGKWHTDCRADIYLSKWEEKVLSPLRKITRNPKARDFSRIVTAHLIECINSVIEDLEIKTIAGELENIQVGMLPIAKGIQSTLLEMQVEMKES